MWVSRTFLLFVWYCVLGWAFESTFCTVRDQKWENRGFLYGPVCPIYGFGALAASLAADQAEAAWGMPPVWAVYIVSVLGSAVLEYGTSVILERLFHAVWWDYSRLPFNLHGRISLFTSLSFGVAGVLIVRFIAPFSEGMADRLSLTGMEGLSLACMAVLAADLTLTVSALTDLARSVERMENAWNERMEALVDTAHQRSEEARDRMSVEQARFRERMEDMSQLRRTALRRVRGLRSARMDRERLNGVLSDLREAVRARRKP